MLIYFMWIEKYSLIDFENSFTIEDEICKGTRPLLPPTMPSEIRDIVRLMWNKDTTKRPSMNKICLTMNRCQNIEGDKDERIIGSDLLSESLI